MEYYFENENIDWTSNERVPQSGFKFERIESYSSRMVVSDDDDASVVQQYHQQQEDNKKSDLISDCALNIGISSSHMLTEQTNIVIDGPHQVTPLVQESEEAIARRTTRGNEKEIDNETNLPFCLFQITDDRKTQYTIRPRVKCDHASQMNLVDKYAVNSESTERHDFNACQVKDTSQGMKGIHKNQKQFDANLLTTNPHKIADTLRTTVARPNGYIHNSAINHYNTEPRHDRQILGNATSPHKILSDENKTKNNTKMPSKVAQCLPRQRSRAIAIKRSRPGEYIDHSVARDNYHDKEARQCDVELYDYATWRMYNRIIDHRRKNPLRVQHQEDRTQEQQHIRRPTKNSRMSSSTQDFSTSSMNEHNCDALIHQSSITHEQRYFVRNNVLYPGDDYISGNEDDEIFDFEL